MIDRLLSCLCFNTRLWCKENVGGRRVPNSSHSNRLDTCIVVLEQKVQNRNAEIHSPHLQSSNLKAFRENHPLYDQTKSLRPRKPYHVVTSLLPWCCRVNARASVNYSKDFLGLKAHVHWWVVFWPRSQCRSISLFCSEHPEWQEDTLNSEWNQWEEIRECLSRGKQWTSEPTAQVRSLERIAKMES